MNPTWKVMAPIDLSCATEADIHRAASAAAAIRGELYLVDVGASGPVAPSSDTDGGEHSHHETVKIHRRALPGATVETLDLYADLVNADMVLMNSYGFGKRRGFWKKSITEGMLRYSDRPVSIQSKRRRPLEPIRQILCVMGLDGREGTTLQFVEELAERTGAQLVMLNVVPSPSEGLLFEAMDEGRRPLSTMRASAELSRLARTVRGVTNALVKMGDPGHCIRKAAEQHRADLVVMTRSRGLLAAVYDYYVKGLAEKLDCPLLTVPASRSSIFLEVEEFRPRLQSASDAAGPMGEQEVVVVPKTAGSHARSGMQPQADAGELEKQLDHDTIHASN